MRHYTHDELAAVPNSHRRYLEGNGDQRADLRDADLWCAEFGGAILDDGTKDGLRVRAFALFRGLYRYTAMPVIAENGTEYIRMGCHFRKVSDWAADFWNNPREFPNTGDIASKDRWNAYQTCLQWLDDHRNGE